MGASPTVLARRNSLENSILTKNGPHEERDSDATDEDISSIEATLKGFVERLGTSNQVGEIL